MFINSAHHTFLIFTVFNKALKKQKKKMKEGKYIVQINTQYIQEEHFFKSVFFYVKRYIK